MKNYSTYIKENKSNDVLNIKDYLINLNEIENYIGHLIGIGIPKRDFKMIKISEIKKKSDKRYINGSSVDGIKLEHLAYNDQTFLYDMDKYFEKLKNFLGRILKLLKH